MNGVQQAHGCALYLHIPFCIQKCRYCAFHSWPLPGGAEGRDVLTEYLRALRREIRTVSAHYGRQRLESIYFGGGTPTILEPAELCALLETIGHYFNPADTVEITVEANPGTVSGAGLQALRKFGVNRLSLGAQSFHPEELQLLGRVHTADDIYAAFRTGRAAGFGNINLDLIYALPGQNVADWRCNLQKALDLHPEHLSIYGMSLEEGAPLAADVAAGRLEICPEEEQIAMWETTAALLAEAGYERYEIANFARPGRQCRHNLTYWLNRPYLGLGLAAHGYFRGIRYANYDSIADYLRATAQEELPRALEELQTSEQERTDTIIMGLRLTQGLSRAAFQARFGASFEEVFGEQMNFLIEEGLMGKSEAYIYLTERGRILANYVLAHFV